MRILVVRTNLNTLNEQNSFTKEEIYLVKLLVHLDKNCDTSIKSRREVSKKLYELRKEKLKSENSNDLKIKLISLYSSLPYMVKYFNIFTDSSLKDEEYMKILTAIESEI